MQYAVGCISRPTSLLRWLEDQGNPHRAWLPWAWRDGQRRPLIPGYIYCPIRTAGPFRRTLPQFYRLRWLRYWPTFNMCRIDLAELKAMEQAALSAFDVPFPEHLYFEIGEVVDIVLGPFAGTRATVERCRREYIGLRLPNGMYFRTDRSFLKKSLE